MSERAYQGDGFKVLWDSDVCIHSTKCWKTLPGVFQPREKPWVDVQGAPGNVIEAVVANCPSGALGFAWDAAASAAEAAGAGAQVGEGAPPAVTVVVVGADGPLEVRGDVRIEAADGTLMEQTQRAFLCRCGQSSRKPFCDGTHRKVGFTDPGLPPEA